MHSPCGSGSLDRYGDIRLGSSVNETRQEITFCEHDLRWWNKSHTTNTVCVKCNHIFSLKVVKLSGWESRVRTTSQQAK